MPAPTTCTCTLDVKSFAGATFTNCELVAEPRKSFLENSNIIVGGKQIAAADVNGRCTLTLVETASTGQKIAFTLNWNTGTNFGSIIFDPITIPNQASVDLSTLLSVSRG